MTAKAAALKKAGADVIILSQGEPDFPTPRNIARAGIAAIDAGHTRYTAVAGIEALRAAIAQEMKARTGVSYGADGVTVGGGAKQVLFNAMLATLDPGDEVIIPTPAWVSYREMVALAGGAAVEVECAAENGHKLTATRLAQSISTRTKWLILNSPSNPTGAVYTQDELRSLAEILRASPHVWVLCDDIYDRIVYSDARFSQLLEVAPDLAGRTLVVNGVSKGCAMTGWRLGWGAGPEALTTVMNGIQSQTTSHASSISQYAALEALTGERSYLEKRLSAYEARRNLVVDRMNSTPGLSCRRPDGAFYAFVSCKDLLGAVAPDGAVIGSDETFAAYLLDHHLVAVVPGAAFAAPGYVRLSFASSAEELETACRRIARACRELSREAGATTKTGRA